MSLKASALLTSGSQALLSKLVADPTANVATYNAWKYLCMCFDTPRPSSHEDKIRDKIIDIANQLNLDYAVDAVGNIRVRKPASTGFEDRVRVCIQSHIDMVCSKTATSTHNFHTDGVTVDVTEDGKWIQAKDTTLGADDGAGVAAALAMLEDTTISHGPLECLFTVEEETTMDGALNLAQYPFLESQVLLNVDSEEDHCVCVGCAGGAEVKLFQPVTRLPAAQVKGTAITFSTHGLAGGHTGCDIHTNRANAIQLVSRLASFLHSQYQVTLVSMSGGNAANAIPRDARVTVFVCEDSVDSVETIVSAAQTHYRSLVNQVALAEAQARVGAGGAGGYGGVDEDEAKVKEAELAALTEESARDSCTIRLDVDTVAIDDTWKTHNAPLDAASTAKCLELLSLVPHGVLKYSATVEGAVETSNALSLFSLPATHNTQSTPAQAEEGRHGQCPEEGPSFDHLAVHCFYRSFSEAELTKTGHDLKAIAAKTGASTTEIFGYFNGWEPLTASPAFTAVIDAHRTLFPERPSPHVYSVHAGLECGPIKKQYPDMHAVSIGPLIVGAHSPDEKMMISTMEPFMDWLKMTIVKLAEVKAEDLNKNI